MIRLKTGALSVIWGVAAAYGQGTTAKPQFDVATIKPAEQQPMGMIRIGTNGGPGTKDPGRFTVTNMALSNLIMQAYDVKRFQITGPGFLDTERYDVTAKVPEGATKEQFRLMLQSLLEERFKMVVHMDKKESQVYELVQAKGGHKLKEYVEEPASAQGESVPNPGPPPLPPNPQQMQMGKDGFPVMPKAAAGRGPMMIMMPGRAKMQASGSTIDQITNILSNQLGKPVIDATGLKGKYDFSLSFSPEGLAGGPGGVRMAMPGAPPPPGGGGGGVGVGGGPSPVINDGEPAPTLFAAVQEQLGLKLEQKKGMVDLVVIDKVEKTPSAN